TTPATTPGETPISPELQEAFKGATEKFAASDFNGALEILKATYAKHPEIMPPRVAMTQLFARSNVPQGIPASLEMATKETPNDPEAYLLLAEIAIQQRNLTAAGLLLDKADTLNAAYKANPERQKNMMVNSLRHRVSLCDAREDWGTMHTCLTRLIGVQGETPLLVRQLGVCLFQQKQDAQARELLIKAQGMKDDKGLPADAVLAQLYQLRGDMEKARASLDAAVKANPESLEVHSMYVMMKLSDDKLDEAKAAVEQLYKIDWTANQKEGKQDVSANTKRLVATVALFQGNYAIAERYFQELVTNSPSDAASINGLALSLCEQTTKDAENKDVPDMSKLQRALEYAVGNVQKNQNNREFLATLGWICIKAGRTKQAVEVLQQACADGQMTADTAFYLAKLSVDEGNNDQARRLLEGALSNNRPFLKRSEAQKMFKTLPAAAVASPASPAAPATTR
ncbi:MAG TPA: hypothetical protein DEB39_07100, partial [Planctomycetaceae bacterium]|nr:hypothetical protein [Planctomycetaceae bacterium]